MRHRLHLLGPVALVVCMIACLLTTSSAPFLGYGTQSRAVVVALHSGRIAFIHHAPSYLAAGPLVGIEPSAPSARNFLLPYATSGRRAIISVPIYILVVAAATLAWWQRRRRRARPHGFAVVTLAGDTSPSP